MSFMAVASSDFRLHAVQVAPHGAPCRFDLWSALANGLVAIEQLLLLIDKARSQGAAYLKRTLYGFDFLFSQFTSAHTAKHSVVRIHRFLLGWEKVLDTGCKKTAASEVMLFN
jgi:hypothetical protein